MVGMSLLYIPLCLLIALVLIAGDFGVHGILLLAGIGGGALLFLHVVAVWFNGPPPGSKK